ncbi:hypothetical protein [Candidatus Poriferisodalis sp.]|uniref:hypothetical protein n=1 Tax=Candidatus Poriferisodalis sp. TaxID=3101277 RepID=UPI003B018618
MMALAAFDAWRRQIADADHSVLDFAECWRREIRAELPHDHPDPSNGLIKPTHEDIRDAEAAVDRFRIAAPIERAFASTPGPSSRLTVRAMLVGIVLGALCGRSYSVADICSALAGMPADAAVRLGVQPSDRMLQPISYNTVRKQLKRLERLLDKGFTVDGKDYDIYWFAGCLALAPVPPELVDDITAIAIDSTDYETNARSRDFRKERDVKKDKSTHPDVAAGKRLRDKDIKKLRKAAPDPLVEHRLDSLLESGLDEPDLKELLPEEAVFGTKIGNFGPDYRLIRSYDIDARPGHKSAKGKSKAGFFLGYDLHLAVAVRDFTFRGDRAKAKLGPEVLPFILGVSVKPAATNPAVAGLEVAAMARGIAPQIRDVIADRAYTNKADTFNRALHSLGIDVVTDYTKEERIRDRVVTINRTHQIRFHCGTFLHPWTPQSLRSPPAKFKGEALADWYRQRNRYYRYTQNQSYDDGRKRMTCPVHDKRAKIAATANFNNRHDAPLLPTPKGKKLCCEGHVTISLELLDKYQDTPYGTAAWFLSYGRRNQVENANKELRRTSGLHDESCVKFGLVAHIIASAAAVCAYNIRQARKHRKQQEKAAAEADDQTADTPAKSTGAVAAEHDIVLLTPAETRRNGQQDEFEPAAGNLGHGYGDPTSHPPPT